MAADTTSGSHSPTCTFTGRRISGGVRIKDMSRTPETAICIVRGIGVADSVRMSMCSRRFLNCSLCATPKRCSSSMTISPRSWGFTSRDSSRCVPISTSISPAANCSSVRCCSAAPTKRDSTRTDMPNGSRRSAKLAKCCWARMVVGHSTITCFLFCAATKAARMATSVLPKPTSPQMRRSIGCDERMSAFTSAMAAAWSGVSS